MCGRQTLGSWVSGFPPLVGLVFFFLPLGWTFSPPGALLSTPFPCGVLLLFFGAGVLWSAFFPRFPFFPRQWRVSESKCFPSSSWSAQLGLLVICLLLCDASLVVLRGRLHFAFFSGSPSSSCSSSSSPSTRQALARWRQAARSAYLLIFFPLLPSLSVLAVTNSSSIAAAVRNSKQQDCWGAVLFFSNRTAPSLFPPFPCSC